MRLLLYRGFRRAVIRHLAWADPTVSDARPCQFGAVRVAPPSGLSVVLNERVTRQFRLQDNMNENYNPLALYASDFCIGQDSR